MNESLIVLDIEERLAQDSNGVQRRAMEEALEARLEEVNKALAAGLPPEAHRQQSLLRDGLTSSLQLLRLYWQSCHGTGG